MKKITMIIITLILAIVLTVIQINIVKKAEKGEEQIEAVVYSGTYESGTMLTDNMLKVIKIPKSITPSGLCSQATEVLGGYLLRSVYEGEIVLLQTITSEVPEQNDILSENRDSEGSVLISLKPDPDKAVAWQLKPGQKVNLLYTPTRTGNDSLSFFKLENIKVAGIADDTFSLLDVEGVVSKKVKPIYLILDVTPEEAKMISHAKINGSIEIVRVD